MRGLYAWAIVNAVTESERAEVGMILCDYTPRDMALEIVRLRAKGRLATGDSSFGESQLHHEIEDQ